MCAELIHFLDHLKKGGVFPHSRFTHQGSITVSASYDDEKREIYIEVTDTGIGIAPQNIERIFQPFDQEDFEKSVRKKTDGKFSSEENTYI